MTREELNGKL